MKILCETTGAFQLVDFDAASLVIRANRPTVAGNTYFVSSHAAGGRIRVLGNVNDEATDEEFAAYIRDSEGDLQLAIAAFLDAFQVEEVSSKVEDDSAPEVKPTRKSRKQRDEKPQDESEEAANA